MKNLIPSTIAALCLSSCLAVPAWAAPAADAPASYDVHIAIDGQPFVPAPSLGAPYITAGGRTMLPLRAVSSALGYRVDYDRGAITVIDAHSGYEAQFTVGSTAYTVNRTAKKSDTAPIIRPDGRTYVPLRVIGEAFGGVGWDHANRTVRLNRQTTAPAPTTEKATYTLETADGHLQVARTLSSGAHTLLSLPAPYVTALQSEGLNRPRLAQVKETPHGTLLAIHHPASINDWTMDVFLDRSPRSSEPLVYAGKAVTTSDFATDGTYLFSTDGTAQGAFPIEPNRLYVDRIGTPNEHGFIDVGRAIHKARLDVQGTELLLTQPGGQIDRLSISHWAPRALAVK